MALSPRPTRFEIDRAYALRQALEAGFRPLWNGYPAIRSGPRRILLWERQGPNFVDYLAINLVQDASSWAARYPPGRTQPLRPEPPGERARMPVIQAVREALSWPVGEGTPARVGTTSPRGGHATST